MAKAIAKYLRMSPRKVRRVVNEIRGKKADEAQVILRFMPYAAAKPVIKTLNSAIANAKENEKQDEKELFVTEAFVDQSVTLKRWRPMSRGRAFPRLKRMSSITIVVNSKNNDVSVSEDGTDEESKPKKKVKKVQSEKSTKSEKKSTKKSSSKKSKEG